MLELSRIRIDGGTQSRVELNQDVVTEYAEAYKSGEKFPPVIVFFDGSDRWLADGFHRYFGAKAAGVESIYEEVIPGTKRDAILYSLKANATHGLKRTNADKRKAVETLLVDAEWATWSDNAIAKACTVDHKTVAKLRADYLGNSQDTPAVRTVERSGKTYQINTEHIGSKAGLAKDGVGNVVYSDGHPLKVPMPPPAPVVEPEHEAPPEYTELDAAQDQISGLQDALAVATMGDISDEDKAQAATLIAELRARIKTLEATLKAVTTSRDTYMNENAELRKQITRQRKEIDKVTGRKTA